MARSRAKASKKSTKGGKDSGGKDSAQRGDGGDNTGEAAAGAATAAAPSVLSPELVAELGDSSAGGAMVTKKSKNKKRGRAISSETRELAATMSKSRAKKLKQLEDKKLKDGRRAELYQKLEKNRMSQDQLSLLQSSKTISMNQDTLKSRIKQAVQRAVAGITLDDVAIRELESHPGPVADVEEALSLPVGGALAAVRRSKGSAKPEEARGKQGGGGGEGGGGSGMSVAAGAKKKAEKKPSAAAAQPGDKTVAVVSSSAKRSRDDAAAVPVAAPKGSKRIQVVPVKAPRGNGSSKGGGSGIEGKSDKKTSAAEKPSTAAGAAASGTEPAASGTAAEAASAATSGSSWAAKMMSSMARLPTSGSTSEWGALSSGSAAGKTTATARTAEEENGEDGARVRGSGDEYEDSDDADGPDQSASAPIYAEEVASYPPPPSWLEGNAPAYRAVETPLPSVSGDAATGGRPAAAAASSNLPRPKRWVPVKRPAALQAARMQLPVCGMEQEITEAVHDNDTIILCGETGSGKSTQVPQFLYEAGYAAHGLIGVTQPRRVAAVGTAERVAVELGTKCGRGGAVAYQIRYDASGVGEKTRVKFMTDGVLLQEITSDLLLRKYSVVLLDEAHERNLNTDVLLGMLSRSIPLRKQVAQEEQRAYNILSEDSKNKAKKPLRPLKLVIMSATLRVSDFTENTRLFPVPPPVISATSRQHPVTVHFSKRTELYDYVGETFKKVCKIHQRLPEGGILVFLTGKREIIHMCDKLRREFRPPRPTTKRGRKKHSDDAGSTGAAEELDAETGASAANKGKGQKTLMSDKDDKETEEGAAVGAKRKQRTEKGDDEEQEQEEPDAMQEEEGGGVGNALTKGKGPVKADAPEPQRQKEGEEKKDEEEEEKKKKRLQETDREALLYREADDDEEDAARLSDMEDGSDDDNNDDEEEQDEENHGADSPETAAAAAAATSDSDDGEGGLSSDSDAEDGGTARGGGKMGAFGDDEDNDDGEGGGGGTRQALPPVHVVPLYAMLTADEQATVFRPPPEGHRLVVVATNVAETSITIPGISYVVDCGRQKRRVAQRGSGISQFEVGWVSKASADQRAGRAGRTGPGHCYRLYSSAVYTQTLEAFAPPEVLTRPLEDVMLQMKAMGVVDVARFPFPTPPDATGLRSAATLLANLGATAGRGNVGGSGGGKSKSGRDSGDDDSDSGEITAVGKALALLPVGARYAKMLLLAVQGGLLAHAAALVAMLTEGDPFVRPESAVKKDDGDEREGKEEEGGGGGGDAEEVRRRRAQWLHPTSDALARLKAAGAYAHATSGGTAAGGGDFCRENFLHGPTMDRSLQLRRQLSRLVNLRFSTEPGWKDCDVAGTLRPPTRRQSDALRQVLLSGLLDNVARRAPAGTVKAGSKLFRECAYLSCNEAVTEPLYIKSTSVLFSRDPLDLPEWVVYQDIVRGEREGAAANMTCVTAIDAAWIPALAEGSPLLSFSDPLVSPPPTYDHEKTHAVMCRVTPRYGVHAWELPPHLTELASAAPKNRPDTVFRWFGRLLLEGGVAGCLSELKEKAMLNDPPSLVTRERPTKKVGILVLELRQKGVSSLPALVQQWRRDPTYLKSAVEMWIKLGDKKAFEEAWRTATRAAVAALAAAVAAAAAASAARGKTDAPPCKAVVAAARGDQLGKTGAGAGNVAGAGPRAKQDKGGQAPRKRMKKTSNS